jgi:(p)ppGpp synthase/HD superfamily hydrolase
MAIAFTLGNMGCSADLVIAGVLHDVLEDTDVSESDITNAFGENVTRIVKSVSENKQLSTWRERKQDYISRIIISEADTKILSLVDKLHNLHTLAHDKSELGSDIWTKFSAPKSEQKWYYLKLLQVYRDDTSLSMDTLVNEMNDLIDRVFSD